MDKKYRRINIELNKKIKDFEKKHGGDCSFYLNENDPIVHSMKMKGEMFKDIELDAEFENTDLLDYLGFERIISCKKDNK